MKEKKNSSRLMPKRQKWMCAMKISINIQTHEAMECKKAPSSTKSQSVYSTPAKALRDRKENVVDSAKKRIKIKMRWTIQHNKARRAEGKSEAKKKKQQPLSAHKIRDFIMRMCEATSDWKWKLLASSARLWYWNLSESEEEKNSMSINGFERTQVYIK